MEETILFPLNSFTTNKKYILSINIDKNKKKFCINHCNCGLIFNGKLRIKCKHIDTVSKMSYNKLIKTYETILNKEKVYSKDTLDSISTIDSIDSIDRVNSVKTKLFIPIKSENSNQEYKIFLTDQFELKCNCGMQYGISLRSKCKHIDAISSLSFNEIRSLTINNLLTNLSI
jgi:hypothetical protein